MNTIIDKLQLLRAEMPDPFHVHNDIKDLYNSKVGQELLNNENNTIHDILLYLQNKPVPALIGPAVLILAYFNPASYYNKLLNIISQCNRLCIEAFDQGLWRINLDEKIIAHDLINLVEETGNQDILLLLQRPVVKEFGKNLEEFIEKQKGQLSLYAMYCYKYLEEKMDLEFLKHISEWADSPELASLAKEYLNELT